jgi:hypothetical protein
VGVAAVLDLDEPAGALRLMDRLACEHIVVEVHASADGRRDLLGGADERGHADVDVRELRRVEVDRAAGHVHLARGLQRTPDRLARLGFGLVGDAARIDHVQLGIALDNLDVTGIDQRAASKHRVRLGDLAAEELDRERGHWCSTVAPGRPSS